MRVKELIEILEDQDPNAEVLTISQKSWPFEYEVAGVTARREVRRAEREENGEEDDNDAADAEEDRRERTAPTDVLIVEGKQLRYGSKAAWRVV
ncbi:MAG: hypothetical protein SF187_23710 [Deltaproteobacteria bacterium]|nr:hypothetical protein [Deltaproteobacteria bacterium]